MRRRELLRTLGATTGLVVAIIAGCIESDALEDLPRADDPPSGSTPTPTDEDTPTPSPDETSGGRRDQTMTDITLDPHECVGIDVVFDEDTVEVVGCVKGNNGCHRPEIEQAIVEESTFTLVVASVDQSEPHEMCTQAIVNNGYKVVAEFDTLPDAVEVVHNDMDGQRTVKTTER